MTEAFERLSRYPSPGFMVVRSPNHAATLPDFTNCANWVWLLMTSPFCGPSSCKAVLIGCGTCGKYGTQFQPFATGIGVVATGTGVPSCLIIPASETFSA